MAKRVLVAGVGAEIGYTTAHISFCDIKLGPEDKRGVLMSTRGEEGRQEFVEEFLGQGYQALLLCDLDQTFPRDIVERLWGHQKEVVSGYYTRRNSPVPPVAFAPDKTWPLTPLFSHPDHGLVEIGATGFGCVLIQREVFQKMKPLLKPGEPFISNRDFYEHTGDYRTVGSDLRFFVRCRDLGIKVWMDLDVRCGHATTLFLGWNDYKQQGEDLPLRHNYLKIAEEKGGMNEEALKARMQWHKKEIQVKQEELGKLTAQARRLQDSVRLHIGAIYEIEELLKPSEAKTTVEELPVEKP